MNAPMIMALAFGKAPNHDHGSVALGSAAVDGAHDRVERGREDVRVDADAPKNLAAARRLDVGRCPRVFTGTDGMLGVIEHPNVDTYGAERVHERRDRSVALTVDGLLHAVEF